MKLPCLQIFDIQRRTDIGYGIHKAFGIVGLLMSVELHRLN